MKQIILPIVGTMIFVILVGFFISNPEKYIKNQPSENKQKIIEVKDIEVSVEISDTSEERSKGLSNKESLNEKEGMLFIFEKKDEKPVFWMKDMLIPIDIIWINDNKIVQIDRNIKVPDKNTSESSLTKYSPQIPIDYVLEVNSGFSDKYQLNVNDIVDLSAI